MTRFLLILSLIACASAAAEERKLKDRSERGTLADRVEIIRGDSGKWRDADDDGDAECAFGAACLCQL